MLFVQILPAARRIALKALCKNPLLDTKETQKGSLTQTQPSKNWATLWSDKA